MASTTVVVPCYNEEQRLNSSEFVSYFRQAKDTKVLFVDDGSTDRTADVLMRVRAELPTKACDWSMFSAYCCALVTASSMPRPCQLRLLQEAPASIVSMSISTPSDGAANDHITRSSRFSERGPRLPSV